MSVAPAGREAARTIVEIPSGRGYSDVAVLVLGGVAARMELPVDRVDDLLLAVDGLLLQDTPGTTLRIEADASATRLAVRVGPFTPGRLEDAGLRRMLSRLVDTVAELPHGTQNGVSIELGVTLAGPEAR